MYMHACVCRGSTPDNLHKSQLQIMYNTGHRNAILHLYIDIPIVRTPSLSTFDSLELGRYSDDGRDADEKVAGICYL